jgi:hypothetical protein
MKGKDLNRLGILCVAMLVGLALTGCGKGDEKSGETGEKSSVVLGEAPIAGYTVKVTQDSDYKPGGKTKYMMKPSGGKGEPTAVRAWVGVESGEGSLKAKAGYDAADGDYDAVVEVPATPSADAKLWVEVEAGGKREKASFPSHK